MAVRRFSKRQLDEAVRFSWNLCGDIRTRSYPLFAGRDALQAEYRRSLSHEDGVLAGCYRRGCLKGVVCGLAQPKDRYIQMTGFYVARNDHEAASALVAYIAERFPGFTVHIGMPAENAAAAQAVQAYGYRLVDNCLDLRLQPRNFPAAEDSHDAALRIDEASLPEYLSFHDRFFGDCYWNAQRLQAHFADWLVYACRTEGAVTGGIFLRRTADMAEIYGLRAETQSAARMLMAHAVRALFARNPGVATVIFMADTGDQAAVGAALSLGFRQENHYLCYSSR